MTFPVSFLRLLSYVTIVTYDTHMRFENENKAERAGSVTHMRVAGLWIENILREREFSENIIFIGYETLLDDIKRYFY
jgi:hypothetical protein